jgi:hypothetical protein
MGATPLVRIFAISGAQLPVTRWTQWDQSNFNKKVKSSDWIKNIKIGPKSQSWGLARSTKPQKDGVKRTDHTSTD